MSSFVRIHNIDLNHLTPGESYFTRIRGSEFLSDNIDFWQYAYVKLLRIGNDIVEVELICSEKRIHACMLFTSNNIEFLPLMEMEEHIHKMNVTYEDVADPRVSVVGSGLLASSEFRQ